MVWKKLTVSIDQLWTWRHGLAGCCHPIVVHQRCPPTLSFSFPRSIPCLLPLLYTPFGSGKIKASLLTDLQFRCSLSAIDFDFALSWCYAPALEPFSEEGSLELVVITEKSCQCCTTSVSWVLLLSFRILCQSPGRQGGRTIFTCLLTPWQNSPPVLQRKESPPTLVGERFKGQSSFVASALYISSNS